MSRLLVVPLLVALVLLSVARSSNAVVPQAQVQALGAFYNATSGATSWTKGANTWLVGDPCLPAPWFGVSCSADNSSVTGLSLPRNNLKGTIVPSISDITTLQTIALGYNAELVGAIPTELGLLTDLVTLELGNCGFTSTIPTELGQLSKLNSLFLASNTGISGTLPTELGSLSSVTYLNIWHTSISGTIPTEIGQLTQLQYLSIQENLLNGSLPSTFANLASLEGLFAQSNALTSTIPSFLGTLTNLDELFLSDNLLFGTIPTELGALTKLFGLALDRNQLSGTIPFQLDFLEKLGVLTLNNNDLISPLPDFLQVDPHIQDINLADNSFACGTLPAWCDQAPIGNGKCAPCVPAPPTNYLCCYYSGNGLTFQSYSTGMCPSSLGYALTMVVPVDSSDDCPITEWTRS